MTFASVVGKLGPAAPLAAAWMVMPPLGSIVLFTFMGTVGAWLRGHEAAGLLLYAAAFAVLAGLAMLPTYASAILGGWAFGFAWGLPAALAGFCGGAIIGYLIARGAARDRAVRLIEEHEKWRIVRDALIGDTDQGGSGHGFWKMLGVVALVRLPPSSPFAMTNLVMAAVKVRFLPYVLGTLIGMAPRTGVAVYIAAHVQNSAARDVAKDKPVWWIVASIVLGLVVLSILGAVAKRALERVARRQARSSPADAARASTQEV